MYDYTQALRRSRTSRENGAAPREVDVGGRSWLVLPGVFSPGDSRSSAAHLALLDFPVDGSLLEIGSGCGLIAVSAALAGCRGVVATDLNPVAVENTALNARRFGVADAVSCRLGDLFAPLAEEERFDVVYWHSNNVWTPPALTPEHVHELAYVDPGYDAHKRFFRDARAHLAPGGRVLLGVSSRAERTHLDLFAAHEHQRLVSLASTTVTEPEGPVVYELLELLGG
ncbi:methyltransferase [Saccharothrix sp. NPDC042600]|uniref:methyltransferase n=1 Tax=Saccharothrix TaxID=2071 RepID=UPI0033E80343|nr:hypothetical protein GCM10017745_58220 [Saccharothrix mutabilis subsp. capreolus]